MKNRSYCHRTAKLRFSFLVLALYGMLTVTAFEYEANGIFEGTKHYAGGKVQKLDPVRFAVFVRDCQWMIRVGSEKDSFERKDIVCGFDGTNLFKLGVSVVFGRNIWDGAVKTREMPHYSTPHIPIIFTALADGCYLQGVTNKMAAPYWDDDPQPILGVRVQKRSEVVGLPESIVFLMSASSKPNRPMAPGNGKRGGVFTNAVFSATGFRDIGGVELPSEFSLRVYVPQRRKGSIESFLLSEYRGTVTNINPKCSLASFIPRIPANITGRILDSRFAKTAPPDMIALGFGYSATNWLSLEEVKGLPGFSAYMASPPVLAREVQ